MILQPPPCAAPSGLDNGMNVEAVLTCPSGKVFFRCIHPAKLANLIFGEFYFSVFLTSVRRAMLHSVHAIVRACCPSQMLWIDTLSVSAIVRCISKLGRARSVSDFTNQAGYSDPSTFSGVVWISVPVDRKRPFDAIFGAYLKGIKDEIIGFRHSLKLADFRR